MRTTTSDYLIIQLLQGFEWFDECLQLSLQDAGWSQLSRSESMVMMHVNLGVIRPSDIARSLGLTRQAVHSTVGMLVRREICEMVPDANHGRIKIVRLTKLGKNMRLDAQQIIKGVTTELSRRVGARQIAALTDAFQRNWGDPFVYKIGTDAPESTLQATKHIGNKREASHTANSK